jgi:DNA transformation protein
MSSDRRLTALRNIGPKIASRLQAAGIRSEADLRAVGPVEAHRRIRAMHPDETLPVCYYLYAFEGALTDAHWDAIGKRRKRELKEQVGLDEL